jgi:hypothetical protein
MPKVIETKNLETNEELLKRLVEKLKKAKK